MSTAPTHFLSASSEARGTAVAEERNRMNRRRPRASATVYTSFSSKQIAGFKEAFALIDTDSNGLISSDDVETMLSNLGTVTPFLGPTFNMHSSSSG